MNPVPTPTGGWASTSVDTQVASSSAHTTKLRHNEAASGGSMLSTATATATTSSRRSHETSSINSSSNSLNLIAIRLHCVTNNDVSRVTKLMVLVDNTKRIHTTRLIWNSVRNGFNTQQIFLPVNSCASEVEVRIRILSDTTNETGSVITTLDSVSIHNRTSLGFVWSNECIESPQIELWMQKACSQSSHRYAYHQQQQKQPRLIQYQGLDWHDLRVFVYGVTNVPPTVSSLVVQLSAHGCDTVTSRAIDKERFTACNQEMRLTRVNDDKVNNVDVSSKGILLIELLSPSNDLSIALQTSIPLTHIQPFQQYNLRLNMSSHHPCSEIYALITPICRHDNDDDDDDDDDGEDKICSYDPTLAKVQVTLSCVSNCPHDMIIAVAYICESESSLLNIISDSLGSWPPFVSGTIDRDNDEMNSKRRHILPIINARSYKRINESIKIYHDFALLSQHNTMIAVALYAQADEISSSTLLLGVATMPLTRVSVGMTTSVLSESNITLSWNASWNIPPIEGINSDWNINESSTNFHHIINGQNRRKNYSQIKTFERRGPGREFKAMHLPLAPLPSSTWPPSSLEQGNSEDWLPRKIPSFSSNKNSQKPDGQVTRLKNELKRVNIDADRRIDTIRTYEVEIAALRKQIEDMHRERKEMKKKLRDLDVLEELVLKQQHGVQQAHVPMLQALLIRAKKDARLQAKNSAFAQRKLTKMFELIERAKTTERNYLKLQDAHEEQAQCMKRLQQDNHRTEKFKRTINTQETVITHLEELLNTSLQNIKQMENSIDIAKLEKIKTDETAQNNQSWKNQYENAQRRIIALQTEMQHSATQTAAEVTSLKALLLQKDLDLAALSAIDSKTSSDVDQEDLES